MNKRLVSLEIICALFTLLFLYTAVSKILSLEITRLQLGEVFISPFATVLSWLVPTVEVLAVALLFFSKTRLIGLYVSTGLMIVFTIFVSWILSLDGELPCTCGGILASLTWPQHLILNALFITIGVVGIMFQKNIARMANARELALPSNNLHK